MKETITRGAYNFAFYFAMFWVSGLTGLTRAIPPFIQMAADIAALLYIGAFLSLKFYSFIYKPTSETEKPLTSDESWKMPLTAVFVLVGLFILFKYIGKEYVNYALVGYFSLLGLYSVKFWIDNLTEDISLFQPLRELEVAHIEVYRWFKGKYDVSAFDLLGYIISSVIIGIYIYFRDWVSNNIIGAAFCLYGFENIYIGRFSTAFIMLSLFFVYDIYFVFGTTIMVTIALGIDGPIKLLLPRVTDPRNSLIGLGDILVPGLLLTLCLRYDLSEYLNSCMKDPKAKLKKIFPKNSYDFPKPYFTTCFIGYAIGLCITIAVGTIFNASQPALLYLVPTTVIPVIILSITKGDFKKVMAYDEEAETTRLKELIKPSDKA